MVKLRMILGYFPWGALVLADSSSLASIPTIQTLRDPFLLYQPKPCPTVILPTASWSLKGIVGRDDSRVAWLVSTENQWIALRIGERIADEWQVTELSAHTLRLTYVSNYEDWEARCLPDEIPQMVALSLASD